MLKAPSVYVLIKNPKSAFLGWLTAEESVVFAGGFAVCSCLLAEGGGYCPLTSKKLNAAAVTTAVHHGKMRL